MLAAIKLTRFVRVKVEPKTGVQWLTKSGLKIYFKCNWKSEKIPYIEGELRC